MATDEMQPPQNPPGGALDDTPLNVQVGADPAEKRVIVQFARPIMWFGLINDEPIELARSIIQAARACGNTTPLNLED